MEVPSRARPHRRDAAKGRRSLQADEPTTTEDLVPIRWFAGRIFQAMASTPGAFIDTAASKGFWQLGPECWDSSSETCRCYGRQRRRHDRARLGRHPHLAD